jgi:hypothetical protein
VHSVEKEEVPVSPHRRVLHLLFLGIVLALSAAGQEKTLSTEGRTLTNALAELQKNPADPAVQAQYLKAFPHDYKTFLALFEPDRELYDGHEFILVLPSLAKNHETEVGHLLVQLSKNAQWNADAPNHLEQATIVYGDEHTQTFAALLQQLSATERSTLITFLAHAQNYAVYPEYQTLIDHLRDIGRGDLAREFEVARERRLQRPRG